MRIPTCGHGRITDYACALHRLRQLAPVIKDHGVDYERTKFQERLDSGLTLARTIASVQSAIAQARQLEVVNEPALRSGTVASFVAVHTLVLMSTITCAQLAQPDNVPETLLLDVQRLEEMQRHYHVAVNHFTLLTHVSNFLGTHAPTVQESVKRNVIEATAKNIIDDIYLEVYDTDMVCGAALAAITALEIPDHDKMDCFTKAVKEIREPGNQIRRLM
jgi:hypothetical protein